MPHQVADAVELVAGRPTVVFGHSYGGNVALALSVALPELVLGVALYESPLSWEPWWPRHTAGSHAMADAGDPAHAAEVFMRRMIGDERWEALPERTRRTRRSEGVAMTGELADLRRVPPWNADQITVPVRAGYGSLGRPHHQAAMRHLGTTIKRSTVCELDGCRHDAPLQRPELVLKKLLSPLLALHAEFSG
jgi:pimeloyl-ACP methyl ester carboxylesterase